MKFALLVIAIIAAIWSIGYLRIFIKRCSLALKIKSTCRSTGATLRPTHALWWFGRNGGCCHDIEIELENKVLAVKLFAIKGRLSTLILGDNGRYTVKKYMMLFGRFNSASFPILSRERQMPAYTFAQDTGKPVTPVLLISPAPLAIKGRSGELGDRDICNGMTLMSAKALLDSIGEIK